MKLFMGKQHSETVSQSISGLSLRFRLGATANYVATQLRNMIAEGQHVHNESLPSEKAFSRTISSLEGNNTCSTSGA